MSLKKFAHIWHERSYSWVNYASAVTTNFNSLRLLKKYPPTEWKTFSSPMFFAFCFFALKVYLTHSARGTSPFNWQQAGVKPEWAEEKEGAEAKATPSSSKSNCCQGKCSVKEMGEMDVNIERLRWFTLLRLSYLDPLWGEHVHWFISLRGNIIKTKYWLDKI